jgi:hypothetical protein
VRRGKPGLDYTSLSGLPVGQPGGLADGSQCSFGEGEGTTTGKSRPTASSLESGARRSPDV